MASITTRAGKGSPLTNAEVDANFTNLNTELATKLPLVGGTLTGKLIAGSSDGDSIEVRNDSTSTASSGYITFKNKNGTGAYRPAARISGANIDNAFDGDFLIETYAGGIAYKGLRVDENSNVLLYDTAGNVKFQWDSSNVRALINSNVVLHAGNYNSYSPTLTGTGASGTWGISITGNAATVTNGVVTTGSYADPAWITSINYSKLTGTVPTWNQSTTGNAATATMLQTARTISLTGDVTGSASFNGSANVSITATVADNSHNHSVLYSVDDRDMKPNTSGIATGQAVRPFFSSLGGMTGTANADYQDVLVLDTYSDSSGGNPNAITFDKSEIAVRAWQGAFNGTTWGTAQRFYMDNYHPEADKLTTARTIALSGDVSGSASFDGSSNVTITATVVNDSHEHDGRYFTETESDARFLRRDINESTTGYLQAEGFVNAGTGSLSILNPHNANYATTTATVTGAIRVRLPVLWTSTMMRLTIRVYEYAAGEGFDVVCGGYNYSTGWVNTFAYILGSPNVNRNFNVRFGHDGTYACIYIGETSSTWSYPQVAVTNFVGGYSNYAADTWNDNWDVGFVTTLGTISSTISNSEIGRYLDNQLVLHAGNYNSYSPTLTGGGASGTWGISITGSAASLTTARTINGTSFNGTANITTANWGTARTLTIGAAGKSVNGSANVSWTLSEIAANQTITTSGSTATIVLSDTGTNGANIRLAGNGATTPNKTIRAFNGGLEVLNHAYTGSLLVINDDGNTDIYTRGSSTFQGYSVSAMTASASAYRGIYYDVRNENNVPVANFLCDVNTDGSSGWFWTVTAAGARTTDRRVDAMRITSAGNVGIGTGSPTNIAGYKSVTVSSTTGGWVEVTNGTVRGVLQNGNDYLTLETLSNHPLIFGTNSSERVRITAAGDFGVGTSTPEARFDLSGGAAILRCDPNGYALFSPKFGTSVFGANYDRFEIRVDPNSQVTLLGNSSGGTGSPRALAFLTNSAERARIDTSGNLLVGTSSYYFGITSKATIASTANQDKLVIANYGGGLGWGISFCPANNDAQPMRFLNAGGGYVGGVVTSSASTSYVTSSDYRLKHDIQPLTGALARVAALKPVTYKWNVDNGDGEGFIAHELQEVCPQAVTGEKDAVDDEGNPRYQGVDTSFLVATLTAAIQELKALVDAQSERIATLERM